MSKKLLNRIVLTTILSYVISLAYILATTLFPTAQAATLKEVTKAGTLYLQYEEFGATHSYVFDTTLNCINFYPTLYQKGVKTFGSLAQQLKAGYLETTVTQNGKKVEIQSKRPLCFLLQHQTRTLYLLSTNSVAELDYANLTTSRN